MSSGDHLVVAFTTAAKLAANKSYVSKLDAGVVQSSDSISVVDPAGTSLPNFTMPLDYGFQIHTDASGNIDSWFTAGNINPPTVNGKLNGTGWQAYTMNTLAFIPGSDIIPTPPALVTGHYDYDQATEINFVNSVGTGVYSAIINPSNTSGASWQMVVNTTPVTPPPVATLVLTAVPSQGTVGVDYSYTPTVTGGVAPYTWSASGLPSGLSIDPNSGLVSGQPTTAGTFSSVSITVTDSTGAFSTASNVSIVIAAAPVSCSGTNAPISFVNKWWLDLNGGLANGGQSVVYAPAASTTFTGGTTTFSVGELVDYAGVLDGTGMCDATSMTVKPAAPLYSCTKPSGAKSVQAKGKITVVGSGYIVVGTTTVQTPTCTTVSWNGASGFAVGQRAEYKGYVASGTTVAVSITIN
ncbi:MAG: Ig domain-containing protein [Methylobacter sp.]